MDYVSNDKISIKANHLYLVEYSHTIRIRPYRIKVLVTGYFPCNDEEEYFVGMSFSKVGKKIYREEDFFDEYDFKQHCKLLQDLGEII